MVSGSRRRVRVGTMIAVLSASLIGLLALGAPASAQDENGEIKGSLSTRDAEGEKIGVGDVVFIISDPSGNEVGTGTTDENGDWSVSVPVGTYSVLLDVSTLPEGVDLRNPDKNPAEVVIDTPGKSKGALFPLGEAAVSEVTAIEWVQLFVDGLKLGLLLAMCSIGLSLIYGTTGLTNFAHGEMVTFGAMMAYLFHVTGVFGWQSSLLVAAVFVLFITGVAGGVFNQFVWRPLRRRGVSLIAALVVSIGFSIFLRYVMLYRFGGRAGFYRDYRIQEKWDFVWFTVAPKDLVIMGLSVVILVGVGSALQFTRIGKAMRAVSDNRDLAESSGIDVEKVIRWVWVSGSALAGLGGVMFGVTESIGWEMGFRTLLLMFAGVTLGGLGTAYGALFGSIIVGLFIQMSSLVIPTDMKNVGALVMLVVILLVRPQGLLGRKDRIG
ncbi:MAG: branched-chain amino acid ABC transporter permease [Actinomycetota bacterium]|nr:branched-chain amino acid ABC transporter permease [Actinomycetota bacterium]